MKLYPSILVITLCLAVAGCMDFWPNSPIPLRNTDKPQPYKTNWDHYKVGNPYKVSGVLYKPEVNPSYDETGVASWYGPGFDGMHTANGEVFDEGKISAAHKTLPLPSVVTVFNLENGRSLTLRVNDRGPFVNDRIIDLSKAAAEELGIHDKGTAHVRVKLEKDLTNRLFFPRGKENIHELAAIDKNHAIPAKPASSPVALLNARYKPSAEPTVQDYANISPAARAPQRKVSAAAKGHYIQVGAFGKLESANNVLSHIASIGEGVMEETLLQGNPLYRVQLGPYHNAQDAKSVLLQVNQLGYGDAFMVAK